MFRVSATVLLCTFSAAPSARAAPTGTTYHVTPVTWLERQHATRVDHDGITRLWVTPLPFAFVSQNEVSEAGDLDLLASAERFFHGFEDEIDEVRRFFFRESTEPLVDRLCDFGLGHGHRFRWLCQE
jgi:hypothetical protein